MSSNSKRISMTLRLEHDLYHAMHARAAATEVTHNWLIEQAIAFYLANGSFSITLNSSAAQIVITSKRKK